MTHVSYIQHRTSAQYGADLQYTGPYKCTKWRRSLVGILSNLQVHKMALISDPGHLTRAQNGADLYYSWRLIIKIVHFYLFFNLYTCAIKITVIRL